MSNSVMAPETANIGAGLIDGTAIGQNVPAAGNFSALTINGVPVGTASGNVPAGGSTNQVLSKSSATDFATAWVTSPLFNVAQTWTALQAYTAGLTVGSGAAASTQSLFMQSAAGQIRRIQFRSGALARWDVSTNGTAESGLNAGSSYSVFAYTDAGASSGTLFQGERASGPQGNGKPYFSSMAAGVHNVGRASQPNGVSGDYFTYTDTQPTSTLAANPMATTSGSPNVVITWTAHGLSTAANVNISGAAAVGGLTLSGYYRVTASTTNTITVNAGSNATSTTTGGGSSVAITPDFTTAGVRFDFTATAAGTGFADGMVEYFEARPAHYITLASGLDGPAYQGKFAAALSPSDNSQLNTWSLTGFELDTVNRGADEGYQKSIFAAPRPTVGLLSVPESLSQFTGNEGKNCTSAYVASHNAHANSTGYWVKWYQGFTVGPGALVSNTAGVGGVGGIGLDVFGAYEILGTAPFATTNGSSTVTVSAASSGTGSLTAAHNTPTSVYIPTAVTVNGVTISAGVHAVSNVTASTFDLTGSGTASATGSGGGTTVAWLAFANDVPYAPQKIHGEWAHGILCTGKVDNGALLDAASANLVNGVDFSAATVSGSPFKSTGFTVDNLGNVAALSVTGTGTVQKYAWASIPSASSNSGIIVQVTDIGVGGSLWVSDGSVWHPVGPITLGRSAVAQTISSTTTETTLATIVVPAGAMALNHRLAIDMVWSFTGSTNQKTMRAKLGGTNFIQSLTTTAANVSFRGGGIIANRGAANSQISPPVSLNGGTGFANVAATTGAIDTTSAQNVTITALMASAAETMTLESYEVRLLP